MGRKVKSLYPQKKQYKGSYSAQKKQQKNKKTALICRVVGLILLFGVIICLLPASFPRFVGYEIYNVTNDSMEPEIPVGSAAYIKTSAPAQIKIGDVVTFLDGDTVILNRVIENDINARELTTQGGSGQIEKLRKVSYDDVLGVVSSHLPKMGAFLSACLGFPGRIILLVLVAAGALLIFLSAKISKK